MPLDTSSYYPQAQSSEPEELRQTPEGETPAPEPPAHGPVSGNTPGHEGEPPAAGPLTMVCNLLSWVLVPLLMPVYGLLLAFGLSILGVVPVRGRVTLTLIVFGFNVVIPMLLVVMLKKAGAVDDLGLNSRRERAVPYLMTVLCMGATAWFMWLKGLPLWSAMFFAGGAAAGLINLLVNFKWKISAHAAGAAGLAALLLRIIRDGYPSPAAFWWLVGVVVLAGALGAARIWLGRHTLAQVLAGYAVGFCCVFFLTMIH